MSIQTRARAPSRRWLIVPVLLGTIAFAYALAGFVLAPWLTGRELPRLVEQQLHQRARIGEIEFNPFTLRLHVRDFALETMEGRPLIAFADAVFAFRWLSLLQRAWMLDEVRLVDPAMHLEITKDGWLNLAQLLPASGPEDSTPAVRFAIGNLSVANGSVDFEDQRQGYHERVEHLSIDLASLSTLNTEEGSYALAGQTPRGATLHWKGQIVLTPLAATGTLTIGHAALAELRPYANHFTDIRVVAGRADLELPFRLALEQGKPRLTLKGAKLGLRELVLSGGGERALLARFGAISLGDIDFDSGTQHASVKAAHIGASTIGSDKDKLPLASIGPVALDGLDFDSSRQHASIKAAHIGASTVGPDQDKLPPAHIGPIALDGIDFDSGTRHASVKAVRIDTSTIAPDKDKLRLAHIGPVALEGIDFDLGTQHTSVKAARIGASIIASGKDKLPLANIGPVAVDGIEFDSDKHLASVKAARIGASIIGSDKDKVPLANIGPVAIDGIEFDSDKQLASIKAARIGASIVGSDKDKVPLANIGPVALDGVEYALGTRRGSAHALGVASATLSAGDESKPLAGMRELALEDAAFDLGSQRVSAKALRLSELMLTLERDASGELDLVRMFAGLGGDAAGGDAAGGARRAGWQASIGAVEIVSASARYTDRTAKTPLALAGDGLSGSFRFNAASDDQGVRVRIGRGKLALARLDVIAASAAPGSERQPAVKLANLSVAGARYDSSANRFRAEAMRLGRLGIDTELANGRPSLLDLLPDTGQSKSEKPLSAQIKVFELGEGAVNVDDRDNGIAFGIARLAGKLTDVSTDLAQPIAFDLGADVKSGGRIALRGSAVPAQGTVEAKIDAVSVALAPLASAMARYANVKLSSGDASLSGTLRIGGKDAKLAYAGSASIANLALDEPAGMRLFGWKSLSTETLTATLAPIDIDVDELKLTAPAGRFAIAKDGSSNISHLFPKRAAEAGPAPVSADREPGTAKPDVASGAKADEARASDENAFSVAVRRVRIEQGALDFSDDGVGRGYVAKIVDLAGTANGLSTEHDKRSQFTLEGRVDEFGYARLSGAVNPFAPRNRSSFRVQLRNIDLTTTSPYAMRFAGYRIASGHLALDLNYRVRDSTITGDNKLTMENFTLGEHVDSPDALDVPFELAVALLKDPDGTISLEVPVTGNLDDPEFSLVPLIWKAVGNMIGNVVAAPFRALAHLFGGSAEAGGGAIAFDPGKSRLLPPEREKLRHIAEVLAKRPDLKLLIPAHYDTEADARAMRRAALAREIGRRAGFALLEGDDPGPVNSEDKPTRAALRALFAERFSKAEFDKLRAEAEAKALAAGLAAPSLTDKVRNLASGEPQLVDAREFYQTLLRRLRDAQPLPANALTELAQQRALAIEAALEAAGTDASRLGRTIAEPTADAEAKSVTVHLSLAAR